MGLRAGLDWRKISFPSVFDPGPSNPLSVVMPTELPGSIIVLVVSLHLHVGSSVSTRIIKRKN